MTPMTREEFLVWTTSRGVDRVASSLLLDYAATPEEMQEAQDAIETPPPIYSFDAIVHLTDKDPYGIAPLANGFVLIGGCPNGDPIALDVASKPGSVWYISHEMISDAPLREVSICVAEDLEIMFERMAEGKFPWDYFDAKERAK